MQGTSHFPLIHPFTHTNGSKLSRKHQLQIKVQCFARAHFNMWAEVRGSRGSNHQPSSAAIKVHYEYFTRTWRHVILT